ncbi:IS1634 family transposase [Nostoc sp. FACHB-888]|nr:IS1634 family transposase [Nostoc sp. FACHB-888]
MESGWRKQLFNQKQSQSGVNPLVLPMSKAKAAKILGICPRTLERWAKVASLIPEYRLRVPCTLTAAKILLDNMAQEAFNQSEMPGYRIAPSCSEYGGVRQRWFVVESQARKDADLKQLQKRLIKQLVKAQSELRLLLNQEFACSKDAFIAAQRLSSKLPLHQLTNIQVQEIKKHTGRGRPSKDSSPTFYYQVDATLEPKEIAIAIETKRAGKFILATNVLDAEELSDDDVLREYKAQQSTERGFRFLKDPLFFTSSVFLNSTERVAALAMVMGLCLLVYSLGQRALRQALEQAKKTIDNQLGKPTSTPTLRWVFQCFMSIHLVTVAQIKQIANLTHERQWILQFLGAPCRKYYLLS